MSNPIEIKVNISSKATHQGLERSTTLNRRYVKRPTKLLVTDGTEEEVVAPVEAIEVPKETKIEIDDSPRVEYHKSRKISINEDELVEEKAEANISHIAPMMSKEVAKEPVAEPEVEEIPDLPPAPNPYQAAIDARKKEQEAARQAEIDSRALKDAAIKKALAEMEEASYKARIEEETVEDEREERIAERVMLSEMSEDRKAEKAEKAEKKSRKLAKKAKRARKTEKETRHLKKHKTGRVILAFATSTACVLALAALVKVNLPNISVKVAAIQTGVEASYPSYVPRDYNLTGVYTNDQNSVIIEFSGPDDAKFTLAEDKSSWDSNALLTNYVKGAYGENYDTIREQGITVYISYSNAAWVNNGIFYRITTQSGTLSKKQIKNIVNSL